MWRRLIVFDGRHITWLPFETLSPSDCHPAGLAGPYVAGGPVGPDGTLSPFTSDHAGPAGRHVAVGPAGQFGMLSPSDCHPAGPAVPYVAGAQVSPSTSGYAILVDPGRSTLLPGEG